MESFDFGSTNILNRILFLEGYLEAQSEEDIQSGKGIEKDKIDENDLVELSEKFEESNDTSVLEEAVKKISKIMDMDSSGEISNEELKKFQGILEKIGLTSNEILTLFEKYNIKVSSDVENIDVEQLSDMELDEFKEVISGYPKLRELAEEIGYEKLFNLIDTNGDKKLDDTEIATVSGGDSSEENFSYSDLVKLLKDNGIDVEDTEEKINSDLKAIDDDKELLKKLKAALGIDDDASSQTPVADNSYAAAPSSGGYPSGGSTGGYSSGGSSGGVAGTSAGNSTAPAAETIEQLEQQKTQKQGELTKLNSDMSAVLDGSDSVIADKKTAMDETEEEYKNLLEEEAKENEEVKGYKEELEGVEKDIDENETNINDTEKALNEKQQEISSKETQISGLESEKGALESSLSSLKAIELNDKNRAEVTSKIEEVEGKIIAKDGEIQTAKDELEKLKDDEEELSNNLDDYKDKKKELEEQRKDIEDKIEKAVSKETQDALHAYQEAREDYEKAKETRLGEVKDDIKTKETEINDIEVKIQKLKAEQIERENQVGPYAMYNAERGQALADAANSLYGGVSKGGGKCATGVSQAIAKAYGYTTHGNGCDYGNVLSGLDDWVEITDQITSAADLKNLPAGAIVSWSPYNTTSLGRLYGHVYISDGQGHEISDFKGNITTYYADRGSQYRVFLPT